MTLRLSSPAFTQNAKIPNQFSRDGGNVSPPIEWQGAPAGTPSYALVVGDPDAPRGMFWPWAAFDIPPDAQRLAEGAGSGERGAAGPRGQNEFGNPHPKLPQPPT